jgi:hypothetical protein
MCNQMFFFKLSFLCSFVQMKIFIIVNMTLKMEILEAQISDKINSLLIEIYTSNRSFLKCITSKIRKILTDS